MPVYDRTTIIHASLERVFDFFAQPENLLRITPPSMHMRIVRGPQRRLREGDVITYSLRVAGLIPIRWTARLTHWRENESFADLQERGPFRHWLHTHTFRAAGPATEMHDHVEYETWLGDWFVRRQLRVAFDYRERVVGELIGA
jgi:ligand-binding SRPBCC domain-containing protein